MRPSAYLLLAVFFLSSATGMLVAALSEKRSEYFLACERAAGMVHALGLSDLVLTTEARYTRHPAVSDAVVPGMDHPLGIDHFPSGSFFHPVP